MSERKTWTAQEDQILRQLYERRCIKKWSTISQLMESNYHIMGRSGKQCRERYHNHLKGGIRKDRWTNQEEQKLVELHALHGNKWALISKLIAGRTQNCVKNMLNSKFRKSVRLLNRFIYLYHRKTLKQIKISFINRLSEFSEAAHKKAEDQRSPEEKSAIQIKNGILRQGDYQAHQMTQQQKEAVRLLIQQIHVFKKDHHKHYRGNVLARLKKKLRSKRDNQEEQHMERSQEQSTMPRQPGNVQTSYALKKLKLKDNQQLRNISRQPGFNQIDNQTNKNRIKGQEEMEIQPTGECKVKTRGSLMRLQSLESNFQSILGNQGLEKPIQLQNYMQNITPIPKYDNLDFMDWTLSMMDWRIHAD